MPASLGLRPIQHADQAFLCAVYASTRQAELAVVAWSDAEKELFIQQQFTAQHTYYRQHFPDASFQIVLGDGVPLGRLYVARTAHEVRIVDISLLPEHRGAGIGTRLLRQVQAEAARDGKEVTIRVEKFNPAQRLYQRLGFQQVADLGVYLQLSWQPAAVPQAKIAS